jgi:hypothetical protein
MRIRHQLATRLMIIALAAAPLAMSACAGHRVYDPYYGDYHRWNSAEDGYYRQWEGETRRAHVDFGGRTPEEQHAYYDWRHRR